MLLMWYKNKEGKKVFKTHNHAERICVYLKRTKHLSMQHVFFIIIYSFLFSLLKIN